MSSLLLLLFEYLDLVLRTFIAVTTIVFSMASVDYPATPESRRKKKRGRDADSRMKEKEARRDGVSDGSRKTRRTNGLLTPHASFAGGTEEEEKVIKRTVKRHPPISSAERDANDLSRDIKRLERREAKLLKDLRIVQKDLKGLRSFFVSSATLEESSEVENDEEEGRRTPVQSSRSDTYNNEHEDQGLEMPKGRHTDESECESDAQTEDGCESDSASTSSSELPKKTSQVISTAIVNAPMTPITPTSAPVVAPSLSPEIPPVGPPIDPNPSTHFVFFDLEASTVVSLSACF